MQKSVWLALSYNVPINPSKARVYVWRKLKEIGAEYFRQGVAVLPSTSQGAQQFHTLAQKIRQMGGEAALVELRFLDPKDEADMTAKFKKQIEQEYSELLSDCAGALRLLRGEKPTVTPQDSERIKQMIKRYRKTRSRDYLKLGAEGELEAGINEIIDCVRELAGDVGRQLRSLMEN